MAARAIGREQAAAEEHQRLASRKPRKAREQIAQRRESLGDLQLGDAANRARFRLNLRQGALLRSAATDLLRAVSRATSLGMEFVSADLRAALSALGGISGRSTDEDLLDRIFSRFCLGK